MKKKSIGQQPYVPVVGVHAYGSSAHDLAGGSSSSLSCSGLSFEHDGFTRMAVQAAVIAALLVFAAIAGAMGEG